ncbi:MAG: manganese efflux pump MntP family protein [Chloroflexota bacterium]
MDSLLELIFISISLGIDAFTVAFAVGSLSNGETTRRQKFRLSFHFGLFQFLMPLIGWLAGAKINDYIADFDHWIALAILAAIGGKMIRDSFKSQEERSERDATRGMTLIALSIATSLDAMAIGFAIGLLQREIFLPSVFIGVVAATMTYVGIKLGAKARNTFGDKLTFIGGLVLIGIGVKIVIEHIS